MATGYDLLCDENDDLLIAGSDFWIGESNIQEVQHIIKANIGFYKQFPEVGVGIQNYLNSSGKEQELKRLIQLQLQNDGFKTESLEITTVPNDFIIKFFGERI